MATVLEVATLVSVSKDAVLDAFSAQDEQRAAAAKWAADLARATSSESVAATARDIIARLRPDLDCRYVRTKVVINPLAHTHDQIKKAATGTQPGLLSVPSPGGADGTVPAHGFNLYEELRPAVRWWGIEVQRARVRRLASVMFWDEPQGILVSATIDDRRCIDFVSRLLAEVETLLDQPLIKGTIGVKGLPG